MSSSQDEMFGLVNHCSLLLSVISPQQKDQIGTRTVERRNYRISKLFPATIGVRSGFMSFDSQSSIEKEYTLLGPTGQIAVSRNLEAVREFLQQFLVNVL